MADHHESIKWEVISDWTEEWRGRLFCMNQGLAFPARMENGETRPAKHPIWFGPLKRKFKGFPDLFGWEWAVPHGYDISLEAAIGGRIAVPWFCVVEVKTKSDTIRPHQRRILNMFISFGVHCYIAKEMDSGYEIIEWKKE